MSPFSAQAFITMYSRRPDTTSNKSIRKISPNVISNINHPTVPPCTSENWQHLVNIVMKLVKETQNKDSIIADLADRLTQMETTFDQGSVSN